MSGQGADELRIRGILRSRGVGPDAPQPDAVTAAAAAALTPSAPQPQPSEGDASDGWWDALYPDEDTAPAADAEPDTAAQPRASRLRIPPWWTGEHVDTAAPDDGPDERDEEPDEEDLGEQDDPEEDDEDQDEREEDEPDAQPRTRTRGRTRSRPGKLRKTRPAKGKARRRRRDPHAPSSPLDTAPRRSLLDAIAAVPPRIRWLLVHASAAAAGYRLGWVDYATRTAAWIADNGWLNLSTGFWCSVAVGCEVLRYRARTWRLLIRWLAAVPIASIVTGTLLYGTGWQTLDLGELL